MKLSNFTEGKSFKVLAGIDLSPASRGVLRRALSLANAGGGGEVHAAAVADHSRVTLGLHDLGQSVTLADAATRLHDLATDVVGEFTAGSSPVNVRRVVTHLLDGDPAQELVWLAAHLDADLIVVGTHGRKGLSRILLGSVAERVVRLAGCPVCVVREKHHSAAWKVPEIEPPCPDCLAVRNASEGKELWCARHKGHIHTHVYSGAEASVSASRAVAPWGFSV